MPIDNQAFALPDTSQLLAFLASCPGLHGLPTVELQLLASELRLIRYEDGHRFFADEVPDRSAPLRIIVHGRATWDPTQSNEQKGAWMLSPGSLFGLEAINDWASEHELDRPCMWSRREIPRVRCQAIGVTWVLELAPDRFDAVLMPEAGRPLLDRLLCLCVTTVFAPEVVATMRKSPQFSRVQATDLYRLLESTPVTTWSTQQAKPLQLDLEQIEQKQPPPGPQALYYVIRGEMQVALDDQVTTLTAGEMDGPDLFAPPSETAKIAWPTALSETCVAVMITRDALERMIRRNPGFARSLGPLDQAKKAAP